MLLVFNFGTIGRTLKYTDIKEIYKCTCLSTSHSLYDNMTFILLVSPTLQCFTDDSRKDEKEFIFRTCPYQCYKYTQ